MLSLAAITVVLRSNFIRPSQIIAALIRPKALFVTSPHPLATVTVFPRPCGLLEALKHGLHSLPAEWQCLFTDPGIFHTAHRQAPCSGLTLPWCHNSVAYIWCGIAVLPCFSASGKVPVTRCGLPLRGTYAAYWPSSRLDCHTLMCGWRPASIPTGHSWAKSQGRRISSRSFQRALSFPCEP